MYKYNQPWALHDSSSSSVFVISFFWFSFHTVDSFLLFFSLESDAGQGLMASPAWQWGDTPARKVLVGGADFLDIPPDSSSRLAIALDKAPVQSVQPFK